MNIDSKYDAVIRKALAAHHEALVDDQQDDPENAARHNEDIDLLEELNYQFPFILEDVESIEMAEAVRDFVAEHPTPSN